MAQNLLIITQFMWFFRIVALLGATESLKQDDEYDNKNKKFINI